MGNAPESIHVQVCYTSPDRTILRDLTVPAETSVQEAIVRSGLMQDVPEIDLAVSRVGVYGKLKALDATLRDHDRVEIYRPLIADPKESRRRRADKKAEKKTGK